MKKMNHCSICQSSSRRIVYQGKIRVAKFADSSDAEHTVFACTNCEARYLDEYLIPDDFYSSDQYAASIYGKDAADIALKLKQEYYPDFLNWISSSLDRRQNVMELGAGSGFFTEYLHSRVGTVSVIEPNDRFRQALQGAGYPSFASSADAIIDNRGSKDIVFCLSVIEHILDPVSVLKECYEMLRPGGSLFITTPNADDFLLTLLPEAYGRFFYRRVHPWYFSLTALKNLAQTSGFTVGDYKYSQRFGFNNFYNWLKEERPTGTGTSQEISPATDARWVKALESLGVSDYLFMRLDKTS